MERLAAARAAPTGPRRRFIGVAILAGGLASGCDDGQHLAAPTGSANDPIVVPRREIPRTARPDPSGHPSAPATHPSASIRSPTDIGCPDGMARRGRFCIDRFEIRLISRTDGTPHPHNVHPPADLHGFLARSEHGVFPQGHLSQRQADAACNNAGKRLCSLDEWQSACRGKESWAFPYGPARIEGACNVNKRDPHILDKYFPDIPHMKRAGKEFNDERLLLDPDYLATTGKSAPCSTYDGISDMDGNLSEWVGDTVMKSLGGKETAFGTFAGDAFSGGGTQGCGRKTDAHAADYYDYSMGTRCCKDAGQLR